MKKLSKKMIVVMLVAAFFCATACDSTQKTGENTMRERNNTKVQAKDINDYAEKSMFAVGEPNTAYAKYFIGNSWLAPLNSEDASIANVTFEPGCRNNWHIHHCSSQILVGVGGKGWIQFEGKEPQAINEGDVVRIPPEVKHWHGAAADSWFSHLSITVNTCEGAGSEWLEPVSDEEYNKLK